MVFQKNALRNRSKGSIRNKDTLLLLASPKKRKWIFKRALRHIGNVLLSRKRSTSQSKAASHLAGLFLDKTNPRKQSFPDTDTHEDTSMKVILIPGMGCNPVARSNWYSWFAKEINKRPNWSCDLGNFPDPYQCRESIWLPHVQKLMQGEPPENLVIVGHSSGAACAMRLLERMGQGVGGGGDDKPLACCILVAAALTDLGDEDERLSGYFNRPWNFQDMAKGASKIVLFHGTDDHLIPVQEARYIAEKLSCADHFEYREMDGHSHFFEPWPEILEVIDALAR